MNRRDFLSRATAFVGGASVLGLSGVASAQPQPRDMVPPGEQKAMPLPFKPDSLKGISEQQITWHHDRHYAGYIKGRNEIEKQLAGMDPAKEGFDAKLFSGLKRQQTFNMCGQILHENYFSVLGGDGQADANSEIATALRRDFGSLQAWQADLTATATAAGVGWGVTCLDRSSGRLVNILVELHQNGAIWNAAPIVALDAWEHAFYHDYGPDKPKYFGAFFENLHWGRIGEICRAAMV